MEFEFNLDELNLDNSDGLEEFNFESVGQAGGSNDFENNNNSGDGSGDVDAPLPGEELLEEEDPATNNNAEAESDGNNGEQKN